MYGENNGIFSLHNYYEANIYSLIEALIVSLSPPSENLTNVLSNTNHHDTQ